MSLLLLQRLSARKLPVTLTAPEEVDTIRILKAAGLVEAEIERQPDRTVESWCAQVRAITPRGWLELERVAQRLVFGA